MISLRDVTYRYPQAMRPALRGLNLDIADGSFVGLVGANGAGKSTLCAALAGFIPHHFHGELTGKLTVAGRDVAATPLAEMVTHVGLVFQNPFNQLSGAKLTVEEEVAFGLENLGVPRDEMRRRVGAVLELMGLSALAGRSPYALSGGEMQRVALASVLVMEPPVIVLDEPTAQLDPLGTTQVFRAVQSLVAGRGHTVILASHQTEWLAEYTDRVLALDGGEIVLDGPPREVLTSPRLEEIGVAVSRYTQAARAALERGRWPREQPLPATLEQAVRGFHAVEAARQK